MKENICALFWLYLLVRQSGGGRGGMMEHNVSPRPEELGLKKKLDKKNTLFISFQHHIKIFSDGAHA